MNIDGDWPHDETDEPHDDFVENLEEIEHDLRLFSHLTNHDSKGNAEDD